MVPSIGIQCTRPIENWAIQSKDIGCFVSKALEFMIVWSHNSGTARQHPSLQSQCITPGGTGQASITSGKQFHPFQCISRLGLDRGCMPNHKTYLSLGGWSRVCQTDVPHCLYLQNALAIINWRCREGCCGSGENISCRGHTPVRVPNTITQHNATVIFEARPC